MQADSADEVGRLDALAVEARAAGDSAAEAIALQDAAVELIARGGDVPGARARLRRALALHTAAGRTLDAAGNRYLQALVEGRVAGDGPAAATLLEQALAGFDATGRAEMAGRCRMHLANMALGSGEPGRADALLEAAAKDFARAGDTDRGQQAVSARIMTLQLLSRPSDALDLVGRTLAATPPDAEAGIALRLQRLQLLRQAPQSAELPVDNLDAVLADAERAGHLSMAGQVLLSRAAARLLDGDLAGARADAEATRAAALAVPDPVLYLLACLSLAELHEAAGDRVAAITALFTCQASLADLLGEEARKPVLWVIATRRRSWGEAAWQQIMTAYRQQFT